ncbi:MAG: hypothetical protein PHF86_11220 [Candidatus Nanoarchaeia archaeon]|nr:hypothetical protein [Candidatus Nanoarchaeia archaeon]
MIIKHFGLYVKNIELVHSIFLKLGFSCTYNEIEIWENKETNIRKYIYKGQKLELIQNDNAICNSYHICIEGKIPNFLQDYNVLRDYTILEGKAFNPKLKLFFVYIGDSIYFEFVRSKE